MTVLPTLVRGARLTATFRQLRIEINSCGVVLRILSSDTDPLAPFFDIWAVHLRSHKASRRFVWPSEVSVGRSGSRAGDGMPGEGGWG